MKGLRDRAIIAVQYPSNSGLGRVRRSGQVAMANVWFVTIAAPSLSSMRVPQWMSGSFGRAWIECPFASLHFPRWMFVTLVLLFMTHVTLGLILAGD